MSEPVKGILAMVFCCVVWGLSPIYYKELAHIPPLDVLAHRTLWSLVFFALVLAPQRRMGEIATALASWRTLGIILFCAVMISINWFTFIWSVGNEKATEASLGYFLFPLAAVVLGRVFFAENPARLQWGAIALAACAVVVLTYGLGVAPWIALMLAVTFGLYGVAKKALSVGPVVSVAAEVLLLAPIALWVVWRADLPFGADMGDLMLLVFSGVLTGGPLVLFSYATKRVALTTVGIVQYLNPTLQFFCAVVIFGEAIGIWHKIAFPMIWVALLLYSTVAIIEERAARRVATSG